MTDRQLWLLLQRRAAELEPEVGRALLEFYDTLRESLPQRELERLIREGRVDFLISEHLSDQALREAFQSLRGEIQEALRRSMLEQWRQMPRRFQPTIAFDLLSPQVLEAAQTIDTRVYRRIGDDIRAAFREVVVDGLRDGQNARTIARRATDQVGLSPRSIAAVERFRGELEAGDRTALGRRLQRGVMLDTQGRPVERGGHAGGQGLSPAEVEFLRERLGREPLTRGQIDGMVRAYERRLRAWEAEANTRSATLDAMRAGNRASWEQAVADGLIDRALLAKRRVVVRDGREREEHAAIRGQVVHFDEPYANGEVVSGDSSYGCRCIDRYFLVASVEQLERLKAETRPTPPSAAGALASAGVGA